MTAARFATLRPREIAIISMFGDGVGDQTIPHHLPAVSTILAPRAVATQLALTESYRQLAEATPDAYLPDVAMSLRTLTVSLVRLDAPSRPWLSRTGSRHYLLAAAN